VAAPEMGLCEECIIPTHHVQNRKCTPSNVLRRPRERGPRQHRRGRRPPPPHRVRGTGLGARRKLAAPRLAALARIPRSGISRPQPGSIAASQFGCKLGLFGVGMGPQSGSRASASRAGPHWSHRLGGMRTDAGAGRGPHTYLRAIR
jgi:hypothetical protein